MNQRYNGRANIAEANVAAAECLVLDMEVGKAEPFGQSLEVLLRQVRKGRGCR